MLMVIDALSGGKMLQVESLRMDAPDFCQRSRADFTQPWSRLKDGSHDTGGKAGSLPCLENGASFKVTRAQRIRR